MRKVNNALLLITLLALLALTFAGCEPSSYKLSVSASPDAGGTISPSSGTYEKGVTVDVTASPASGYRFDHWEGGASGASPTVRVTMDSNKNLTAYFTKTYALSASSAPSAGGSVSPSSGTYDEGQEVTLAASPAQYYRFTGWAGDASGSSDHVTITMDSNKSVVASFTKLTYSIEAQVEGPGGTVDPIGGTFEAGTHVAVIATADSGYRFDHWGGSASGTSNPLNLLIDADKTVTAYFTKTYTLSVASDPLGSGSINPDGGVYDAGTKVTLTPVAVFPYAFDHWSGTDNDALNPTTVTMNADMSVTVYLKQLSPGSPQTTGERLCDQTSVPIQLGAGQWLQGQISGSIYDVLVQITNASGTVLKDLGQVSLTNFTFQAQASGTYYVIITDSNWGFCTNYAFTYTIYS